MFTIKTIGDTSGILFFRSYAATLASTIFLIKHPSIPTSTTWWFISEMIITHGICSSISHCVR
jgi:hypothetical protein